MVSLPILGLHRILPRVGPLAEQTHHVLVPGRLGITLVLAAPGDDSGGRPLTKREIAETGLSSEALVSVAVENLTRSADADFDGTGPPPRGVLAILSEDGRAVDRGLLLEKLFQSTPLGGWLVTMPAADRLFISPLERIEDVEAVVPIRALCHVVAEQKRSAVDDTLYWLLDGLWEEVTVHESPVGDVEIDPSPRLSQALERLAVMELAGQAGEA